jgi:hypothetical protein
MLFNPAMFVNPFWPPHQRVDGEAMTAAIEAAPAGEQLRLVFLRAREAAPGERVVMLPIAAGTRWSSRFEAIGMRLVTDASGARVAEVSFGSTAERIGVLAGDRLVALERDRHGPSAQWLYLPALAFVAWVWRRQCVRRRAA